MLKTQRQNRLDLGADLNPDVRALIEHRCDARLPYEFATARRLWGQDYMGAFIDFPYVNTLSGLYSVLTSGKAGADQVADYWEIWSMAFDHTASMSQLDKQYKWLAGRGRGAPRVYAIDELTAMYQVCRIIVKERHASHA